MLLELLPLHWQGVRAERAGGGHPAKLVVHPPVEDEGQVVVADEAAEAALDRAAVAAVLATDAELIVGLKED